VGKPYKFTKKFNIAQAIALMSLALFLCWDHVNYFLFGIFVWVSFCKLVDSNEPTNLQRLIWGYKKDNK
jgi:hypothetical protein